MINQLKYLDRSILMTYKHKMHAVDSDGKIVSSADFDFYIVEVMLLAHPLPTSLFCKSLC
jgi:hypothetical protein